MDQEKKPKSMLVAYLLWAFLGVFGAHRFYLGEKGVIQLISVIPFMVGIFWVLADVFLIPGLVKRKNAEASQPV